ncbi:VanZ family protein [Clostridium sardiniense]|uniref:VanZ family protein n=1 Tax=Clostridium sardiniense TaxID=29369 RepID=A0ABS7KX32_CLOSR|nr:VanZ family protein [Clostridium sardiniense]MBY0755364.1 VanZ family protein [Clostridium sardiniense]MDQ0459810.1 glycopeptide antibiotics resistance protein [Clostridium sardiniense]
MKSIVKNICIFIGCLFIIWFLYYNFLGDIVSRVISDAPLAYLSIMVIIAITLFIIVRSIIDKKFNKGYIDIIAIMYFIIIMILTFFKGNYSGVNLNPFEIINEFNDYFGHALLLLISNIFIYVPVSIYIKFKTRISNKNLVSVFLVYIIIVEITQFTLNRGILDINDIITNTLGFTMGIYIYSCIVRMIKSKSKYLECKSVLD